MSKTNQLYEFAFIPNINDQLIDLAENMAMTEVWSYRYKANSGPIPILYNYIFYTFDRLKEQQKIAISGDWSCFNTGLVTPNQEEIYALFQKNRIPDKQPWIFKGFRCESHRELINFGELPDIATYFDDPSELLYDPRLDLRPRYDHIINDHPSERFPDPYKNVDDANTRHQLRNILQGAIDHAKRRIRRNYKTAVPQFFQGRIQLLVPLCLTSQSEADLALVVEKTGNTYTASTCLTLDMAYNNARLIARPDNEWLAP